MFTDPRRRWTISIALAIAVVEMLIGIARFPRATPDVPQPKPERIVLERPTPTPTPKPTPPPIVHVARPTPAPVPQVAAARAPAPKAVVHGGKRAKPILHHYTFHVYKHIVKSTAGTAAGVSGTGAGISAGAANGGGDSGTQGAGSGASGTGAGAVNANTPCGEVTFIPRGAPHYRDGAASERIEATVSYPDGHSESDVFPYPWVYQNGEQDDPWSNTNLKRDVPIPLVFPPPGSDATSFPPIIKYILDHTRPDGTTVLSDCPKPAN